MVVFSQAVRLSCYKGLRNCNRSSVRSLIKRNFVSGERNLVRSTKQNQNQNRTTSNEHVPESNKNANAFAECSQKQSKLKTPWLSLIECGSPFFVSKSDENRATYRVIYKQKVVCSGSGSYFFAYLCSHAAQDIHRAANATRWVYLMITNTDENKCFSIYQDSE